MSTLPKRSVVGIPSGMRLGPYEIVSLLGAGGMGEVYLARDTRLERTVAIKILPSHLSTHHDLKSRFQSEARLISGLQHPHICVLYDIGNQDGIDYLVMEYLEGETLHTIMEQGPVPLKDVFAIGIEIGGALENAHRHGIIHRDIKPGNIMLTHSGAKLMDFGLAKMQTLLAADAGDMAALATISSPAPAVTMAGTVVGTIQYMSPEQVQGKELDGRSDIFSLAAVLYEAVTGVRPFKGTTMLEIASNLLHAEPIAPCVINPAVPRDLERIILKALAKDCSQRYQSAQEFVDDLRFAQQDGFVHQAGGARQNEIAGSAGHHQSPTLLLVSSVNKTAVNVVRALRRPRIPIFYILLVLLAAMFIASLGFRVLRPRVYEPSAQAQHWYDVGAGALRDGAYFQASKAFERAISTDDKFLLAHASMAEAMLEMDHPDRAKDELLRAAVTGRSSLTNTDSLYLDAVIASVRHDYSKAIDLYRQIADQSPAAEKPYVLVDLGRAYEKAEQPRNAMDAYRQASEQNSQYATPFLRLGILYGRQHELAKALNSFDKAEAIYQALGRLEGRAEVAFQRGALFNQLNKLKEANSSLERALTLAKAADNKSQEIRTLLQMSSVEVDAGETGRALENAREAVALAQKTGMEDLVSRGLVDLGNSFLITNQYGEAEKYYDQALELAQKNKAPRNEARARMSLASLRVQQNRADEALAYLEPALAFYRQGGYRTETALGLGLLSRANQQKGEYASALKANEQLLQVAQQGMEPSEIAFAESELAASLALVGRFPEALTHLEQAQPVYKALGMQRNFAYNQLNRANYLMQLGGLSECATLFDETLSVADRRSGDFQELSILVNVGRARLSLIQNHFSAAKTGADKVLAAAKEKFPEAALEAERLLAAAQEAGGSSKVAKQTAADALELAKRLNDPGQLAQTQLVAAQTLLSTGDNQGALETANQAQVFFARAGQMASNWQALLIPGLASRGLGDTAKSHEYGARAEESLAKLRQSWGPEVFESYLRRPDIQRLQKRLKQLSASER
jgi:serine/threonine protein kinase/tetratricopeptide (TPR) repeat protein